MSHSVCFSKSYIKQQYRFQNQSTIPKLLDKVDEVKASKNNIVVPHEKIIRRRHRLQRKLDVLHSKMRNILNQPQYMLRFLVPGRLIRILNGAVDWG